MASIDGFLMLVTEAHRAAYRVMASNSAALLKALVDPIGTPWMVMTESSP